MPAMNDRIGLFVQRHRWAVLLGFLVVAATLMGLVPTPPEELRKSGTLPSSAPSFQAAAALKKFFPASSGLSEGVLVFERRNGPLTEQDFQAIEDIASLIRRPAIAGGGQDRPAITVISPAMTALPNNPLTGRPLARNLLVSPLTDQGQATLIFVHLPANFIARASDLAIDRIRTTLAEQNLRLGLSVAVSGSAGFGHDYAAAARASHRQTIRVTLAAVLVILLIIYRSPVAALVPLGAISIAAVVAVKLLDAAAFVGMHTGTAESIFVFVLLYGAGVDYSLLIISRCREFRAAGASPTEAASNGLSKSFWAILAAATTSAGGLLMLVVAEYGGFRTAGVATAIAIMVAMLASVTLVPALVGILGDKLFWPWKIRTHAGAAEAGQRGLWRRIALVVTRQPALVMVLTVVALSIPAAHGTRLTWVYDTLAQVAGEQQQSVGSAATGLEMVKRHWPVGEVAPVTVLVETAQPLSTEQWNQVSQHLTDAIGRQADTRDLRSLSHPLGTSTGPVANTLVKTFALGKFVPQYVSRDGRATRLTVVLDQSPLTLQAMAATRDIAAAAKAAVTRMKLDATVRVGGITAEMADVRATTQADFLRVAALCLAVIFLIVLALLKDPFLSAFMVAATLLSYLATLGISGWVFTGLMGDAGLDWKVQIFLFVVLIVVGQDYNIFLASRLAQEALSLPLLRATRQAVVHTGPVISSCGIIMAATLGSLMAGHLQTLRQLGFALSLGMIIDTFIVRPFLLPAFVALTGRAGGGRLAKWRGNRRR